MIITLENTTTSEIASHLISFREDSGSSASTRVLTLIVVVNSFSEVARAIEISDAASREHPCRVLVVVDAPSSDDEPTLDAEIRVGASAGPSEVIVLMPRGRATADVDLLVMPLLLTDTPVVTYWPGEAPANPAEHSLGRLAVRRITDSREADCPVATLNELAKVYQPGDSDLAWSGVTLWRALLATVVEDLSSPITSVHVTGNATHPSSYLIAVWMNRMLDVPVTHEVDPEAETVTGVFFELADGSKASLTRSATGTVAHLDRTGLMTTDVNLARRSVQDCLMEELRRLDPDHFYGRIITEDLASYPPVAQQVCVVGQDK